MNIPKPFWYFNLSQTQHTTGGAFLAWLYYIADPELVSLVNSSGFPHDGGRHTLEIRDTIDNVSAWLKLLKEVAPKKHHDAIDAIEQHVSKRIVTTPAEKRLFKYDGFDVGLKINLLDGPLEKEDIPDFEIGA